MAIGTQKITVAECNACGRQEFSENPQFVGKGLRGTAKVEQDGYGFEVSWYSCSLAPGHIGRAVASAVKDGPQEQGAGYRVSE